MAVFPETIQNIGIVPLAGIPRDKDAVARGVKRLAEAGGRAVMPSTSCQPLRFMAGTDEQRTAALHELLDDPEIDALMAMKGGYGSARMLEQVDWEKMRSRNLPFIGFSDVTAFHLAALKHGCRNHFYGPMLASTFGRDLKTTEDHNAYRLTMTSLENALAGGRNLLPWGTEGCRTIQEGTASGPLVPACLSVLVSLIGTPHLPELGRHILAIEDINEPAHKIDRYLNQLRQAGILSRLKGLIFGQFTEMEDAEYFESIVREYSRCIAGPVVAGVPFGHGQPSLTLPSGLEVVLEANGKTIRLARAPLADFQSQIYTAENGRTMGYRWLEPKQIEDGRRYPLVVILHGAGERGEDNALQLTHVAPAFTEPAVREQYPCFVLVPQCPAGEQWVNTPWGQTSHAMPEKPSQALNMVIRLLDDLRQDYPVDERRIVVMGLSMGGYGTWDLISRFPGRFSAAVPICGGADLEQAENIAQTPVWAFHGDSDSVVPVSRSRDIVAALEKRNATVRYTEVKDCGHNAWTPAVNTPELLPWLFAQHTGK